MFQKDQLFTLIKSLSQGEKAFFIKSLPQSTKKNETTDYLVLFYAMDKMEEYEDEKLREKLKDSTFIKHISVVKNYLFNLILKHLKGFHDGASTKSELLEVLQDAEILMKKAFYKESYRVLQKAEKMAEKYELFTFLLEIYDRLLRLNYDLLTDVEINNYSLEIYEKQKTVFSKIAEIAELKYLRNLRNDIYFGNESETVKEQRQLQLLVHPLLKDNYAFKSYNSGINYYHLRGRILMHCSEVGKKKKAYEVIEKLVAHIESDPDLLSIHPINYATALNNLVYIHHQVKTDDYEGSLKIINKLSEIKTESQYLKYRIQEKVIVNMLTYYLFSKKHQEGAAYIKQVEKELVENEDMYNSAMFMAAIDSFSMICFLNGEYSKSLKWANAILNHKSTIRSDILCFTKVLNLMIHYELGNVDHLEYILRPTERFLMKNNSYETYHKIVVLFLKDIIFETNRGILQKKFRSLSESLAIIEKMDSEKVLFLLFNFREWADKKVQSLS
jgi:hypothetical protein